MWLRCFHGKNEGTYASLVDSWGLAVFHPFFHWEGDANRVTPEYADDVVAKLKKARSRCHEPPFIDHSDYPNWCLGIVFVVFSLYFIEAENQSSACEPDALLLRQEANTFKAYAKDKNYKKAMKTLEKYRLFGVEGPITSSPSSNVADEVPTGKSPPEAWSVWVSRGWGATTYEFQRPWIHDPIGV